MATAFRLPELGENIESGDVVQVLVKPGDDVVVDQPVLELETDKATVEVPSPVSGRVVAVEVRPGETISVGQLILTVDGESDMAAPVPAPQGEATDEARALAERREPSPPEESQGKVRPGPSGGLELRDAARAAPNRGAAVAPILAAPSIRRLAHEIGVDIGQVTGSGDRGRVVADDVKAHAKRALLELGRFGAGAAVEDPALPDFERWGPVERAPMRAIRRATAARMSRSWRAVPHVTQHDRADLTQLEALRATLKRETPDRRLTVTALAVGVLAAALEAFPRFNASLDPSREEIVYKGYINIGVAVDTDRGLLVPVVKNADRKSLAEISAEIAGLADKARTKRLALDEMEGGTFTLTNLGGLGGTAFTPIINFPEVAVLGLSRSVYEPVLNPLTGRFEPRPMLPLSLSYDHRLIDGADAVRFLRWVAERLEQPSLLMLDGSER